ncbi:hypothetical protein D3H55_20105 [Bacillus salacetis]|uniref:Uncharacterized protein n=1 Tax=Bacillus salacetis TaxID=2315464 RepID=A0A3A1QTC0_9BACI|nr:hypothetical protein D3H55_20105 [Bacillus salacetis]
MYEGNEEGEGINIWYCMQSGTTSWSMPGVSENKRWICLENLQTNKEHLIFGMHGPRSKYQMPYKNFNNIFLSSYAG